jgi:hypothetical protein
MREAAESRAGRVHRLVETIANAGIIAVAILGSAVLVRQLGSGPGRAPAAPRQLPRPVAPVAGSVLALPGVDFATADQTLVFVLSTACHFCSDSAPFYRRLVAATADRGRTALVAVLPQRENEGRAYLSQLGVNIPRVVQRPLASVGTGGTPTLVLVDRRGEVQRVWMGRLPTAAEEDVITAVAGASEKGDP